MCAAPLILLLGLLSRTANAATMSAPPAPITIPSIEGGIVVAGEAAVAGDDAGDDAAASTAPPTFALNFANATAAPTAPATSDEAPTPAPPVIFTPTGPKPATPAGADGPGKGGGWMVAAAVGGSAGLCALTSLVLQFQRHHRKRRRRRKGKGRQWRPSLATVPEDGMLSAICEEEDEVPHEIAIEIVI